jgi:CDP-6-deoxy-D-xylo-4-hexulose-3-dehydrase
MLTIRDLNELDRKKFQTFLENNGIQTRLLFAGNITKQPCFSNIVLGKDYKTVGTLPNTDMVMTNSIWMGVYPGLNPADIEYMGQTVRRFIHDHTCYGSFWPNWTFSQDQIDE